MFSIKKSLRAKFTLILILVGIIPLLATSLYFYNSTKNALFKNVFKELEWNTKEVTGIVEAYFAEAAKDLLLASRNAAFRMYFTDVENRAQWLEEQRRILRQLRALYPEMLDEACFIDREGQEICRIVHDELAAQDDLSSEEERATFFKGSFEVPEGVVYQARPTISEDTKRWVLPNATPIMVNGEKVAILHFEVTMTYFQNLLKKVINPERGYGLIINEDGEIIAHTRMEISEKGPLPVAAGPKTPEGLKRIYEKMAARESGIERFSEEGEDFFISYRPIATSVPNTVNKNRWSIGYVIPGERVYVELAILRHNVFAVVITLAFVIIIAGVFGKYITRPISELAAAVNQVAAGRMPTIKVTREDEIGQLSASFNQMAEAVKRRNEALKELASRDGLTGLYNNRYFKEALEREIKRAERFKHPLSLIMADIDYFKYYNDSHGHVAGDTVLKTVAGVFLKNTREVDIAARYGGEEFAVILPNTDLKDALKVAERIRNGIAEVPVPHEETQPKGNLTISIGVAAFTADRASPIAFIKAADRALYRAKDLGRNRVCYGDGA